MSFILMSVGVNRAHVLLLVSAALICSFINNDNRPITNLDIREHVNKGKRL